MVIAFVCIKLHNPIGCLHFLVQHFGELPGHLFICRAVMQLDGSIQITQISVR